MHKIVLALLAAALLGWWGHESIESYQRASFVQKCQSVYGGVVTMDLDGDLAAVDLCRDPITGEAREQR